MNQIETNLFRYLNKLLLLLSLTYIKNIFFKVKIQCL